MDKDVHKKQVKRVTVRRTLPQYLVLSGVVLFAGCGGGSGSSESQPPAIDLGPLSGVISIESGSRIDQDTMDQLRFVDASPASGSQILPASFVLAGFVSSRDGSYPPLNGQLFSYAADPVDNYTVPMGPGETVILRNFGGRDGNAELELRVTGGGILYGAVETDTDRPSVSVTLGSGAPEGNYSVEVSVASVGGPARYVLVKAADSQLDSVSLDWPDYQFLPGQAIVTLDATDSGTMSSLATGMANAERHLGGSDWLMRMPAQASSRAVSATQRQAETLSWVTQLRQMPGVKDAVLNYTMSSMQSSPVDEPLYRLQWHYDLINGPGAWQLAPDGGAGVSVAVLDSGLFSPNGTTAWHPDLDANVDGGRDFVDNDFYPEDPGSSVGASVFHGTHVAGTVAAVVNGEGIGGVAFGSRIVPVRVLGEGGTGSSTALIDAIKWVTGQSPALSSPRADVVNLSLGGLPRIQALEDAIAFGVGRDMVFVGAAGNSATSTQSFPAASPNVLAVSAVDARGELAPYSNFGGWIDLAAPGGDARRSELVLSTSAVVGPNGFEPTYTGLQGTSMATPHVSAVIALLVAQARQQGLELSYASVRALLESGNITDYPGSRSDKLGFGVLDAAKALRENLNEEITILSPSPALVSLSSEGKFSERVVLNPIGGQSVSEVVLENELPWIEVSLTGPSSSGQYFLDIDLNEAAIQPDQAYRGDLVVIYNSDVPGRTVRIPVIAQLISDEQARNAGTHFVLLVDTTPDDDGFYWAEAQVAVEASNGSYGFRFESWDGEEPRRLNEVSPGDYFLVAGTDIDGDGIICQPGEACAEYPISGLREVITIEEGQSLSDLRMTTSFTRPTISAETTDILPRPGFQGYRLITPERDSARINSDNRPRMTQ